MCVSVSVVLLLLPFLALVCGLASLSSQPFLIYAMHAMGATLIYGHAVRMAMSPVLIYVPMWGAWAWDAMIGWMLRMDGWDGMGGRALSCCDWLVARSVGRVGRTFPVGIYIYLYLPCW